MRPHDAGELKSDVAGAASDDKSRELFVGRGRRCIAEKECELRDEIIATILERRRAQEQHARSIADAGEGGVTFRMWIPEVVRFVDDDELRIREWSRGATAQSFGGEEGCADSGSRSRMAPGIDERGRRDDEQTLNRGAHGQRDKGLAETRRVREKGTAGAPEELANPGNGTLLMRVQCKLAEDGHWQLGGQNLAGNACPSRAELRSGFERSAHAESQVSSGAISS
jgi:hypothetical protein